MTKFYTNVKVYGDNILYIGYDSGQRIQKKIPFKPTLYIADQELVGNIRCYDGTVVKPIDFNSIKEAKEFIKMYSGIDNARLYGMDKFPCEYIARNFKGDIEYQSDNIRKFYLDIEVYSGNGFPDPVEAKEKITVITIADSKTKKFHVWGCKDYDPTLNDKDDVISHLRKDIIWKKFVNETEMLYDFIEFWSQNYPDIITGWNSRFFDIPYIVNRIKILLGNSIVKKLSPWGIIQQKTSNIKRFGNTQEEVIHEFYGIAELDYLDLYKKYSESSEESYKLGHIAMTNLGVSKIEYEGSLHDLYTNDYQKYVDYNIQDANIVMMLDKKKKLIDLILEVSYIGHVPTYIDSLGTVKYWEILIYNHLLERGQVTEIKHISSNSVIQYEGAYVKDPIVGLHKWVVSYDLTSLYPSLIRQVNIGAETLLSDKDIPQELIPILQDISVEKLLDKSIDLSALKKHNLSISANGKLYRRDKKSFLSELVGKIFDKRKLYKKQMIEAEREYEKTGDNYHGDLAGMLHIKQLALKILINAVYGACGNGYFQYYSLDNAEAVTITGKVVIQLVNQKLNSYVNSILKTKNIDRLAASDTDSAYFIFDDIVKVVLGENAPKEKVVDFLDKMSREKIEPFIKKTYAELFDYMNNMENYMDMKRESIADSAVWTGKKRYFMNVWDHEGVRYKEPRLSIIGIESVKSSTPAICRGALEEAMKIILSTDKSKLIKFVAKFEEEFRNGLPEDIAFPRGINELNKFIDNNGNYIKGSPIHVRGSCNYNKLLKKHGMEKSKEMITDKDKIKFIYIKSPNIIQDNVIAFHDKLPKQFGLEKYIDYSLQFEKAFLSPLHIITNLIGWKTKEVNSLESL